MQDHNLRDDPAGQTPVAARLSWIFAFAAAATATALAALLDPAMSAGGLAMVYIAAVAVSSVALPRGPALLASLLCVTSLDFFFVPPRGSLVVDGAEYWWTLAVLLGVSLAINLLVSTLRARTAQAELGQARAAQLHALGEAMAAESGYGAMATKAVRLLHEVTGAPCALFLRGGEAGAMSQWAEPADARFHPQSVVWAVENGRPLGRGCDDWPDLPLWCAPLARHRAGGAVQVLLGRDQRPPAATLAHWEAMVRQAGLAIERERASSTAQAAQDSARAEAARNTLLVSLSHDLRTPLAAIEGTASALRTHGEAMPAAQRDRLLATLEDEARDLTLMADNVLQMARLSQPEWRPRMQWESIEDILGAAVARMRRRWPDAAIRLRVAPGLPPVNVEAMLLAQAVANLVDNAVRHGGEPPRITVQAGKDRDRVFIAVRDHGAGLPTADADALFERWRRGEQAAGGGTGLGLAICKLVVQAHDGTIAGKRCEPGTEFRIDLPVAAPPAELA